MCARRYCLLAVSSGLGTGDFRLEPWCFFSHEQREKIQRGDAHWYISESVIREAMSSSAEEKFQDKLGEI